MKKIIGLIMAITILPTLCGCGGSKEKDNVITITMSEEAKKYQEEVVSKGKTKAILSEENFEQLLISLYAREGQSFPKCDAKNKLDSFEFEGNTVYTLEKENYEKIVYYIHGGAWSFPIAEEHVTFCDELVTKLNAKVYMPLYPLAPQANSEQTYTMIEGLYKEILKEGKDIYVMGDSAGGNLSLGLLYEIKTLGLNYPKKTILLSPCVDMSMSNEKMTELDKTDPMLALYGCKRLAAIWAGENNLKNQKNSALYSDVSGYPDIMIFHGTNDILYPDVKSFFDKLNNAGVNAKLVIGEGFWHVFSIDKIPEKQTSLNLIADFCAN